QVNGANVGTQYHAAWSPDIVLDANTPDAWYGDDAGAIFAQCPTAFLTSGPHNVATLRETTQIDERCGSDPATGLNVRVTAYRGIRTLTRVKVAWLAYDYTRQAIWHQGGTEVSRDTASGFFARNGVLRRDIYWAPAGIGTTDAFFDVITAAGKWLLSRTPPVIDNVNQQDEWNNPNTIRAEIGLLDGNNKGKTSGSFSYNHNAFTTTRYGSGEVTEYAMQLTDFFRVTGNKENAWFDRFTLTDIDFEYITSRCYADYTAESRPSFRSYTYYPVGKVYDVLQTLAHDGIIDAAAIQPGRIPGVDYMFITNSMREGAYAVAVDPVKVPSIDGGSARCGTESKSFDTSYKDQNVVDRHYASFRTFF
ncbi:hypothetical protein K7Z63_004803, partial [Salmonella enterica]|nr:hypothetical protein [Salmonella enterica]